MTGISITKKQANYFLVSALIMYAFAFLSTYFVESWFSKNPLWSNLSTYQLISGIPVALTICAMVFLGTTMTKLKRRSLVTIGICGGTLSVMTYFFYSLKFSANPYINMIPSGRTYVLADPTMTVFYVSLLVFLGVVISFVNLLWASRRRRPIIYD